MLSMSKAVIAAAKPKEQQGHDREKQRYVEQSSPFLQPLGITDAQAQIIPSMARKWKQINKQDSTKVLVLGGNGALKCLPLTQTLPNIKIIDDFTASASFVGALAIKEFSQENFVDVSYFEPHYMKEFVAAPPSVKGLK